MAFNSVHFLIFLPVVLAGYWSLRRSATLRIGFLLAASYYFYMSWNVACAGLILASTVLDYLVGKAMYKAPTKRRRRALLALSLIGNLGVLGVFKYYNFFLDSFAHAAGLVGDGLALPHHSLLLPVGISFYTFQTLSYTIDIYRGRLEPARGFLRFALFVSFFPQLVAGPIVRASHFLPQLERDPRFDDHAAQRGLGRILVGLCKKVCIADVLGVALVDPTFADPSTFGSLHLTIAMYAYAFQIYYDFSGYSDIAIGAARMFGFDLPINFDRPYLATSLGNFWRRWHISLSTWLRDYLYFPLGGSRGSTMRVAFNLAVVMLLGGLWHGAAWGFVVWGALHGGLLGAGRVFRSMTGVNPDRDEQPVVSRIVRILVTFHLVAGCFVVFRAQEWGVIRDYFTTLAAVRPGTVEVTPVAFAVLMVAALWEVMPRAWMTSVAVTLVRLPSVIQAGVITVCLLVFAALGGASPPFIYFQF